LPPVPDRRDNGDFTDPGFLDVLDQRTGRRMPKT
jgi:hypothetical protein